MRLRTATGTLPIDFHSSERNRVHTYEDTTTYFTIHTYLFYDAYYTIQTGLVVHTNYILYYRSGKANSLQEVTEYPRVLIRSIGCGQPFFFSREEEGRRLLCTTRDKKTI